MFEYLFFIYLNCFLRTIFIRIIIFILSYYVVSLPYPYPGFLKYVVSPYPTTITKINVYDASFHDVSRKMSSFYL